MQSSLSLKTIRIRDLLKYSFIIPPYQRGYRWRKEHVGRLLEDIMEFKDTENNQQKFYCLQPVVVREISNSGANKKEWEVIDGQQRLTTIFLILKYLEEKGIFKDELFQIKYETRENSEEFLKNIAYKIKDKKNKKKNIDFFCMAEAYEEIDKFFNEKNNNNEKFKDTLLEKVKVIWYEVDSKEYKMDPIEIFTRLNIGKIPLTDAELIKALILKRPNGGSNNNFDQHSRTVERITSEWNDIEIALQDASFWYFIYEPSNKSYSKKIYENRIEYIFDIYSKIKNSTSNCKNNNTYDDYHTFFWFYERLKDKDEEEIRNEWEEIKRYFLILKEWYEDKKFYHLIGYLIAVGSNVADMLREFEKTTKTKTEFKEWLRKEKIFPTIKSKDEGLEEIGEIIDNLKYDANNVKNFLLLFNIALLTTEDSYVRFPFDRYKKERWDIEHIHPQTNKELSVKELKEHIEDVLECLTKKEIKDGNTSEIEEWINDNEGSNEQEQKEKVEIVRRLCEIYKDIKIKPKADKKAVAAVKAEEVKGKYNSIKDKVIDLLKKDGNIVKKIDNIENLTLLDSGTNRSYKNDFFHKKRKKILEKMKEGMFVPIGTQYVFLKAYSPKVDNLMYWTEEDANHYKNCIEDTLKNFFGVKDESGTRT